MQEITGDLFAHNDQGPGAICITTNGFTNAQGANTMGAGCALEAKKRWPGIHMLVGHAICSVGNESAPLTLGGREGEHIYLPAVKPYPQHIVPYHILTFPTKTHWSEDSDRNLIQRSAYRLIQLVDLYGWKSVVLPRPGCGLGNLSWEGQVKPLLEPLLDHRFYVISK